MLDKSFDLLKSKNIKFAVGLSEREFEKIEKIYDFKFPKSLKEFLGEALPVSEGFYNWRNFSDENIAKIKNMMNYVGEYIKSVPCDEYMPSEIYWSQNWGKMPQNLDERKAKIIKEFEKAPKIIPIYSHRFMPIVGDNPPILSIYCTDVIYYGRNLQEYFMHEFCGAEIPSNIKEYQYIPFWTDLI